MPVLEWRACPEQVAPVPYQCSVAEVPLFYRDPVGQSVELVLGNCRCHRNPARKLGTLFWKPGGPGAPAESHSPFSPAPARAL